MAWEIVSSYPVPSNGGMSKLELSFKSSSGYLEVKRYSASGGANTSGLGQGSHAVNYINYYDFNQYSYRIYIAEKMSETLIELTSVPQNGIFHAANIANPVVTNTLIVARELKPPANGKIKDQTPGTVINFAGSPWTILDPMEGKLYKNVANVSSYYGGSDNPVFDPLKSGNIGHYLNGTFFNSLSSEAKAVVLTKNWGVGTLSREEGGANGATPTLSISAMKTREDSKLVTAKVGLLSVSEIRKYWDLVPEVRSLRAWLITPFSIGIYKYAWLAEAGVASNRRLSYEDVNVRNDIYPVLCIDPETNIVNGTVVFNTAPTLTLNTPNNATLYENDTFKIDGSAIESDNGDALTVKYQIDSGTVRNLASAISDGVNPISFAKNLTYSEGILKDGNTVLTGILDKDSPHTISVWAEDGNGGKSNIITRTFFVVPNRPPILSIDRVAVQTDLINSNVINISGYVDDKDKNDVTVTFNINGGEEQQVYVGPPSAFAFNILLNDLKTGANTITIKAVDTYDAATTLVITINKTHNAVPVNQAIALYKINPPTGSAREILLWIERMLGDLAITAEVSMTHEGEPENFVSLPRTNTGPKDGLQEDEFAYKAAAEKTNIILKVIYNRTDAASIQTIKKISGVLS